MTCKPLIAFALVALSCRPGDRSGATARADSAATAAPAGAADFHTPASAAMRERAPDTFRARFETSAGDFVIEVHRDWAPFGADRFYNLVKSGYYDDGRFFRVIAGFMGGAGIPGDHRGAPAGRDAGVSAGRVPAPTR